MNNITLEPTSNKLKYLVVACSYLQLENTLNEYDLEGYRVIQVLYRPSDCCPTIIFERNL